MARPEYRMYAGIRCKTIEYMMNRYIFDSLGYTWFNDHINDKLDEVRLDPKGLLKISHYLNSDYHMYVSTEFAIILDKLVNELGIPKDRIIKGKYWEYKHRFHVYIKIDPEFIKSLTGYLRMLGYQDETKY